ncbi:MAG: trigger factor [Ruminococcaceae bacterium]|nr:trigger factor [Oscillospiraceae bacterium]
MSVKVEKLETNVVELEFEVSKEDFESAMQRSYIKNVKSINIPGFRKGKAPRKIIENMYGKEIFYDDAINFVFPDAYEAALKEAKIEPVSRPDVDIKQFPTDELNLVLTAKVTVKPDVKISKFDKIDAKKPEYPVTDEDIANELKSRQNQNARVITVEDRAAQKDDVVVIDFEGFVDGVAFEGGKGENFNLTLGSGQFIPGFEDQLIGANIGDEVDVNVTFPEEYHAPDLAGKPALFKVKLHSITAKELPELDDEFAKDVSEFDTLDELKNDIKAKLEENNERRAKQEFENDVIDFIISKMKAEIPEIMYENRIDELVRDFEMRLSYQGMSVEQYLGYAGMDMATFRGQFKEQAEKQVKGMLAIEAMAKKEKIKALKDDVTKEYKKLAEQYKMDVDKIKSFINEEDLKKDIITNKTIEALLAMASGEATEE